MKIILTGGGTGGHIIPLISVAKKIKEKNPEIEFLFIGPDGELEKKLMGEAGISIKKIMVGKMRRYFSLANFVDVFKVPIGIIQALWILLWNMPDAIFSKGGYASFPVVFVGWIYRIPVMIHESDANPGLANSVLAKFSRRVAVSYSMTEALFPAEQVVLTGNPLRADIAKGDPQKARTAFNLSESKKVIYVTGGSSGARAINDKIVEILPELLRSCQVIHQTGEKNYERTVREAGELGIKSGHDGYYPVAFVGEELKDILALSDLVISRASANTISEIAANAKPAIFIPLPSAANNHQRMNAFAIAKVGGCIVLEESNLGEHMLLEKIDKILNDEDLRNKLATNIKSFYHPEATEKIADGILGMIK